MRQHKGQENKHHVVTSNESPTFEHGRWSCPGRFFAVNEIKSTLIELLTGYDIAFGPAGQGEGGEFKRPMTFNNEMGYSLDHNEGMPMIQNSKFKIHTMQTLATL